MVKRRSRGTSGLTSQSDGHKSSRGSETGRAGQTLATRPWRASRRRRWRRSVAQRSSSRLRARTRSGAGPLHPSPMGTRPARGLLGALRRPPVAPSAKNTSSSNNLENQSSCLRPERAAWRHRDQTRVLCGESHASPDRGRTLSSRFRGGVAIGAAPSRMCQGGWLVHSEPGSPGTRIRARRETKCHAHVWFLSRR